MDEKLKVLRKLKECGEFESYEEFIHTHLKEIPLEHKELYDIVDTFFKQGIICYKGRNHLIISDKGHKKLEELEEMIISKKTQQIDRENHSENEARLTIWQIKSFRWMFLFAIIGFGYSTFDIVTKITAEPNTEAVTKKHMENYVDSIIFESYKRLQIENKTDSIIVK